MKTDFARPQPRFRNEAVFRSAQRLIASVPQKKAREKFPRSLVFVVGLVVGVGLAIAGLMFWSNLRPNSAVGKAFNDLVARTSTPGPLTSRPTNRSSVTTTPVAATAPEKPADPSPDQPTAPDAQETPRDRTYRAATVASFTASRTPGTPAEREAEAYLMTAGVTHYVAVATLRGELRSDNAAPVGVEFAIRRLADGDGSKLLGLVRYLNGDTRFAANTIAGEIHDHTMTLRETAPAWTLNRAPLPLGRTFVILLPAEPTNAEITGTWNFGTQRGTLALKIAPPW